MSTFLPPVVAELRGEIGNFSAKMATARGEMAATTSAGGAAFAGLAGVGKIAMFGLATAAIAGGAAALKMGADFQSGLTTLVTGAGESRANIDAVGAGILKMSGDVGVSSKQLLQAMFMVDSANIHGADSLKVLEAGAKGAKVGNADLGVTLDAVTTVMKDYHMGVQGAGDATNFLVGVVSQGKTHMEDLAGSLAHVLPFASALHIPLDQIGGAMATMTAKGIPAADAATYLRFTISSLANETPKGAKALKEIGLTSDEVGTMLTTKGLLPAMQLIQQHLTKEFPKGGVAAFDALSAITGGTRGLSASLQLTGTNLADFVTNTATVAAQVKGAHGTILGWSDVQADLNQRVAQTIEAGKAWLTQIGTQMIPYVEHAMDVIGGMVGWLKQHQTVSMMLAGAIGGFLLVAIAAYTIAMISAAVATIAATWPLLLVIAAVAALGAGFVWAYANVGWFRDGVNFLWKEIQILWGWIANSLVPAVVGFGRTAIEVGGNIVSGLVGAVSAVIAFVAALPGVLSGFFGGLISGAEGMVNGVTGWFAHLASTVMAVVGGLVSGAERGWQDFASRPMYWVGYLVGWVIGSVVRLNLWVLSTLHDLAVGGAKWFLSFVESSIDHLQKLPGQVADLLIGIWNNVTAWGGRMIVAGIGIGSQFIASVISFLEQLPGRTWDLLMNVLASVGRWELGLATAGVSAARGLVRAIVDEIGRLPGQMLDLGRQIIAGLVSGIRNAGGSAVQAVVGVGSGMVDGLKAALGIHSPSEVFANQIGLPIAQGVAQGITGGAGEAHSAMNSLVGGLQGGGGGGGVSGASGAGATDHFEKIMRRNADRDHQTLEDIRDLMSLAVDLLRRIDGSSAPSGGVSAVLRAG